MAKKYKYKRISNRDFAKLTLSRSLRKDIENASGVKLTNDEIAIEANDFENRFVSRLHKLATEKRSKKKLDGVM